MTINRKSHTVSDKNDRTRFGGIRRGLQRLASSYVANYEKHYLASGRVDGTIPLRWGTGA